MMNGWLGALSEWSFYLVLSFHPLITLSHFFLLFTSMHLKDFFPSSLVISLFISILSHAFPKYVCGIDFRYATCNSSAECGRLGKIHYPFWVNGSQPWYCGYPWFGLYCHKDEATMWILSELFHVIDMDNRTQTLKIARIYEPSTGNFFCPVFNASIKSTSFSYSSDVEFITFLYNCPPIEGLSSYEYHCVVVNKKQIHSYFVANTSLANRFRSRCGYSALLPVLGSAVEGLMNGSLDVEKALSKGFEVKWTANETQCGGCMESGGRCGYDLNSNTPSCFCRDQPYPESCSRSSSMYPSSFDDFYPSFFLCCFFYYYIKTSVFFYSIIYSIIWMAIVQFRNPFLKYALTHHYFFLITLLYQGPIFHSRLSFILFTSLSQALSIG